MDNALHVARREYLEGVRSKAFLIGVVLAPLLIGGLVIVQFLLAAKAPKPRTMAVVDGTGVLFDPLEARLDASPGNRLPDGGRRITLRREEAGDDPEGAKERLKGEMERGALDYILLLPGDLLERPVSDFYTRNAANVVDLKELHPVLNDVFREARGRLRDLPPEDVKFLTASVRLEQTEVRRGGKEEKGKDFGQAYFAAFGLVMLLFMTIIGTGQMIMSGVVEEKGSRVIEILLSSLEPRQLLWGKIAGIGAVGLTLLLVWSGLGIGALLATQKASLVGGASWGWLLVFFALGFLFYASALAALGSLCNTEKEAQQLVQPVTLVMAVPIMALFYVTQNPDATLTRVLSFIPPFTPFLMMTRMALLPPAPGELLLSIAVLGLSVWLVGRAAARIFRMGILMYGKRPSLYEAWRWARVR